MFDAPLLWWVSPLLTLLLCPPFAHQFLLSLFLSLSLPPLLFSREYSKVPEYWGRDSPYHGNTDFLGTPKNHLDLVSRRPLSPDVFEIDHKSMHYDFPPGPVSSVLNRFTGVALYFGFCSVGALNVVSDVGPLLEAAASCPYLAVPAKLAISFPLVYHYMGGIRHFYWDHYSYGVQSDKTTPLEVPAVKSSSIALMGAAAAASAGLAFVQF